MATDRTHDDEVERVAGIGRRVRSCRHEDGAEVRPNPKITRNTRVSPAARMVRATSIALALGDILKVRDTQRSQTDLVEMRMLTARTRDDHGQPCVPAEGVAVPVALHRHPIGDPARKLYQRLGGHFRFRLDLTSSGLSGQLDAAGGDEVLGILEWQRVLNG
jgi:hypothetical protein